MGPTSGLQWSRKSCKAKSQQWPTSEAARRGGKEVHFGKTGSDTTVNPEQTRNLLRHFSQNTREYHSADSSWDILQATGGDEGGEGGRNIWWRLAQRQKSQSRRDYAKKSTRHAGRPTTQHLLGQLQTACNSLRSPLPSLFPPTPPSPPLNGGEGKGWGGD